MLEVYFSRKAYIKSCPMVNKKLLKTIIEFGAVKMVVCLTH
jgi:hypothetical protein